MCKLEALANFARKLHCKVRLKHKAYGVPEAWAGGIGLPVRGYIELHGPLPFREVEWLEINSLVKEYIGRLVKPKQHNYLENITAFLQSEGIAYSIIVQAIRIPFSKFE